MTTNPTIDGVLVPRSLLKCYLSGGGGDRVEAGHELRELLAAPVVERHEHFAELDLALVLECERAIKQRDEFLRTGIVTAGHGGSHDTCFGAILRQHLPNIIATAPPQLAELQNMTELAMSRGDRVDALRLQVSELQATIDRQAAQILSMHRELHALVPDGYTDPDCAKPTNQEPGQ